MTPHALAAAAMWAGVISLDFTACGPFMFSQPLVCGPLFGWLMGQTAVGVILGGIIQLLWMDVSPIGVGIPYDATATTLLSVFWATSQPHCALSQVVLSLLIAVPFGYVFRYLDQMARKINTRAMRRIEGVPNAHYATGIFLGILGGITWSWVRYTLAYGVLFYVGRLAWYRIAYFPRLTPFDQGLTMAVILLPVAGMGMTLELFLSDEPEGRWALWRANKPGKKENSGS